MANKINDLTIEFGGGLHDNKVKQIIDFLNENYDIRINKFNPAYKEIICNTRDYVFPPSIDEISLHLAENEISVGDNLLKKIINSPNYTKTFDPINEYFQSLEDTYKGISHIERLATLIEAKNYGDKSNGYYQTRQLNLLRKWLVAAVASGLGVYKNQVALGFIQEQEGTGKTSISYWLCPEPLKKMMEKSKKDKTFDFEKSFVRNFIVLFDEFIGIGRNESDYFKSSMSAPHFDIRLPGGINHRRMNNIANIIFTSNNRTGNLKGFIQRGLGTRRFASLHIQSINLEVIEKDLDVDQIWAEAYQLYKDDFKYRWTLEEFADFKDYNEKFYIETNAGNIIDATFRIPDNNDGIWLTPTEILIFLREKKLGTRVELLSLTPEKVGLALKQTGFRKKAKKINGKVVYPYYVRPLK